MAEPEPLETFWAESIYGAMTDQPLVKLGWAGETAHTMSPDQARAIAASIYEAAEAADVDAFLFQFARSTIGTSTSGAVKLLREFREWRKRKPERPPEGQVRG